MVMETFFKRPCDNGGGGVPLSPGVSSVWEDLLFI